MFYIKYLIILLVLLFVPFFVGLFIKYEFFSFAGGSTDSWVSFWGSYGGALIGAITVYLVTSLQNKNQKDLQLESIKLEHNNAINRENRVIYLNQQYEKIEDSFAKIDEIIILYISLSNSVSSFVIYGDIYKDEIKLDISLDIREEEVYKKEIKNKRHFHRKEAINNFGILVSKLSSFSRIVLYIEDIEEDVNHIVKKINEYLEYYKLVINENEVENNIEESSEKFARSILTGILNNADSIKIILESKLKEILDERKELGKYK